MSVVNSMQYVRLMNTTTGTLRTMYDSTPIVFEPSGFPGSVLDLPKAAADYVRGHLLDQVQVLDEGSKAKSYIDRKPEEVFYVANMSGDPDAPDFFMEVYTDKKTGEETPKKVRNELKAPQTFKARLGSYSGFVGPGTLTFKGAQGEMTTNDKPQQVTWPGKLITILPYGRVEVSPSQFQTLMVRDADRAPQYRGQIIRSRKESDFEPDFNDNFWTIDNLRVWLEQVPASDTRVSGKEVMGQTEAEIIAASGNLNETQLAIKLHKVRFELCARCRLRAVDPNIPIPTEQEFKAHKARKDKTLKAGSS